MAEVLIASDAHWVVEEINAALSSVDDIVREVSRGEDVRPAVAEHAPDIAIVDLWKRARVASLTSRC